MQLKKFIGLKKLFVRGLFLCGAVLLSCQLPVRASQSVTLTWNPTAATNVAGYKISFGTTSHNYSATNTTGLATNTTISGLVEGATYYFAASTYDSAGNQSTNSTEVSYVVPAPAATLTSPARSGGQFSFTVSGVAGYQYVVQVSTNLTGWTSVQTNTAPFTFVDTNAAAFKQRFYRTCYLPAP